MGAPKVFGVGFHKTATTSLALALETLGYSVTGPNGTDDRDIAQNFRRLATELAPKYDAFQDNPWPLVYREMDAGFPGSKFILTTRPTDAWLSSVLGHFGDEWAAMRELIYGVGAPLGNEAVFVERYERHNADVRTYFANRPGDFLEIDLTEAQDWGPLCRFLGHDVPDLPFPHANSADNRISRKQFPRDSFVRLREAYRRALRRLES